MISVSFPYIMSDSLNKYYGLGTPIICFYNIISLACLLVNILTVPHLSIQRVDVSFHPFPRYNRASNCEGAGVRLGGWLVDGHQFGHENNVRLSKHFFPPNMIMPRMCLILLGGGCTISLLGDRPCFMYGHLPLAQSTGYRTKLCNPIANVLFRPERKTNKIQSRRHPCPFLSDNEFF